jgi:hypothetical protein
MGSSHVGSAPPQRSLLKVSAEAKNTAEEFEGAIGVAIDNLPKDYESIVTGKGFQSEAGSTERLNGALGIALVNPIAAIAFFFIPKAPVEVDNSGEALAISRDLLDTAKGIWAQTKQALGRARELRNGLLAQASMIDELGKQLTSLSGAAVEMSRYARAVTNVASAAIDRIHRYVKEFETHLEKQAGMYSQGLQSVAFSLGLERRKRDHSLALAQQRRLIDLEMTGVSLRIKKIRGLQLLSQADEDTTCNEWMRQTPLPRQIYKMYSIVFQGLFRVERVRPNDDDQQSYWVLHGLVCDVAFGVDLSDAAYEGIGELNEYVLVNEKALCVDYNIRDPPDLVNTSHIVDTQKRFTSKDNAIQGAYHTLEGLHTHFIGIQTGESSRTWVEDMVRWGIAEPGKPQEAYWPTTDGFNVAPVVQVPPGPTLRIGGRLCWQQSVDNTIGVAYASPRYVPAADAIGGCEAVVDRPWNQGGGNQQESVGSGSYTIPSGVLDEHFDAIVYIPRQVRALNLKRPFVSPRLMAMIRSTRRLQHACYGTLVEVLVMKRGHRFWYEYTDKGLLESGASLLPYRPAVHQYRIGFPRYGWFPEVPDQQQTGNPPLRYVCETKQESTLNVNTRGLSVTARLNFICDTQSQSLATGAILCSRPVEEVVDLRTQSAQSSNPVYANPGTMRWTEETDVTLSMVMQRSIATPEAVQGLVDNLFETQNMLDSIEHDYTSALSTIEDDLIQSERRFTDARTDYDEAINNSNTLSLLIREGINRTAESITDTNASILANRLNILQGLALLPVFCTPFNLPCIERAMQVDFGVQAVVRLTITIIALVGVLFLCVPIIALTGYTVFRRVRVLKLVYVYLLGPLAFCVVAAGTAWLAVVMGRNRIRVPEAACMCMLDSTSVTVPPGTRSPMETMLVDTLATMGGSMQMRRGRIVVRDDVSPQTTSTVITTISSSDWIILPIVLAMLSTLLLYMWYRCKQNATLPSLNYEKMLACVVVTSVLAGLVFVRETTWQCVNICATHDQSVFLVVAIVCSVVFVVIFSKVLYDKIGTCKQACMKRCKTCRDQSNTRRERCQKYTDGCQTRRKRCQKCMDRCKTCRDQSNTSIKHA